MTIPRAVPDDAARDDAGPDGAARGRDLPDTAPQPGAPHTAQPGAPDAPLQPGAPAAAAVKRSGLSQVMGEDFSLAEAIGGVRGLVESMAPGLVFVVVFIATRELLPPLIASLAVAVLAMVLRLVARTPLTQAAGGLIGVLVGVVWAWRSGEAANYFAMGLWTNGAYAVGLTLALLLGWPAVGVVVSLLKGQDMSWRTDPARRALRGRYALATWLWVGMFLVRLAVQVPLYVSAEVAWLGTARLAMGLPLWGLTLWATWVLVKGSTAPAER
ncbi:DUF3159 domain-containing protein [Georgenia sp. SYP-B2076]|uniref:DUF3159 domain-containing protein n=1 Tax=Georgenia sp. SYP-B2076 TaxID=2495881 RepID=UPI000F8D5728|nr:DUF3159 domain-containing protein [Georgenia sp. SYP-B2076]